MSNNNVTDFIDVEYIDYLDTISDDIFEKYKLSIYNILVNKESNEIFEYVFRRLPIDVKYFNATINSYISKKITIQALKFFDSKIIMESIFTNDTTFIFWCQIHTLDVCEYIYTKYRINKCKFPLPQSICKQSVEKFVDYKVYIWIQELKDIKITSNDKCKIVNKLLEKNIFYEYSSILTVKVLKDYLKKLELDDKEYLNYLSKNITVNMLNSIFIKGDENFIVWFFDKIGLDNADIFNKNIFEKALSKMLKELIKNSNYSDLDKIKLIFSYGEIHRIGADLSDLDRAIKYIVSSNHYEYNRINNEIVYEIIKLGVCPNKSKHFYDYYKQIEIIK